MKKLFVVIVLNFLSLIVFSACSYNLKIDILKVEKVFILTLPSAEKEILNKESLIKDINSLSYKKYSDDVKTKGIYNIKILYQDGSYDVLSAYRYYRYDKNDKFIFLKRVKCEETSFNKIVEKFL